MPGAEGATLLTDHYVPLTGQAPGTILVFCQLRQHRAVATRYDKRDFTWRGTVDVASIRIWLRHPVP